MSTGYECSLYGLTEAGKPTRWYYVLQRGECPVGAWDWMEYADCFGPFESEEKAESHLRLNHANPGGWSSGEIAAEKIKPDTTLGKLIAGASRGRRRYF